MFSFLFTSENSSFLNATVALLSTVTDAAGNASFTADSQDLGEHWLSYGSILTYILMTFLFGCYLVNGRRRIVVLPALFLDDIPGHRLMYITVHSSKRVRATVRGQTAFYCQTNYNEITGQVDDSLVLPYFNTITPNDAGEEEFPTEDQSARIILAMKGQYEESPFLTVIIRVSPEYLENVLARVYAHTAPGILASFCSLELKLEHDQELGAQYGINCLQLMGQRRRHQTEIRETLIYPVVPV